MSQFPGTVGSRRGDRHRQRGERNQDYGCYAALPNNLGIVAAVSDGAGSAPKAAAGSRTAAKQAARKAWSTCLSQGNHPNPEIAAHEAVKAARRALEGRAKSDKRPLEEYHATLLVAVMTETGAAIAHIGDGASIVDTPDGFKMFTIPARGQYANETYFVTMPEYEELIARNCTKKASSIFLFTDGVQNAAIDFQRKRPREESLAALQETETRLTEVTKAEQSGRRPRIITERTSGIRRWLEETESTHSDDATMVIIRKLQTAK